MQNGVEECRSWHAGAREGQGGGGRMGPFMWLLSGCLEVSSVSQEERWHLLKKHVPMPAHHLTRSQRLYVSVAVGRVRNLRWKQTKP